MIGSLHTLSCKTVVIIYWSSTQEYHKNQEPFMPRVSVLWVVVMLFFLFSMQKN